MASRICSKISGQVHVNLSNMSEEEHHERVYTFQPVPSYIKNIFAILAAFLCIFGVAANAFALSCKLDDLRSKKTSLQVAFRRRVMCFLMISLSSSDIISALLGGGSLTVHFLGDVFQTQWPCKVSRFILVFSAVISINNLLLISVEKYLGIFYWRKLPSQSTVRWSVLLIWLEAPLISSVSFLFYDSVRVNLEEQCGYTLICDAVHSFPYSKASFMTLFLFAYFIPISFVSYAAFAIIHHIRLSNKRATSDIRKQQLKNARLIVDIIAGFVIPYALIISYHAYRVLTNPKLTFVTEYIYRYISTILVISNCAINPIIYYRRCERFRQKLKESLRSVRGLFVRKKKRVDPELVAKSSSTVVERISIISL